MENHSDNRETEQILNSTNGMRRAMAPTHLLGRIENRLAGRYPAVRTLPFRTVSAAAAGLLLLVAANFYILGRNKAVPQPAPDQVQVLANYYGLLDNGYGI